MLVIALESPLLCRNHSNSKLVEGRNRYLNILLGRLKSKLHKSLFSQFFWQVLIFRSLQVNDGLQSLWNGWTLKLRGSRWKAMKRVVLSGASWDLLKHIVSAYKHHAGTTLKHSSSKVPHFKPMSTCLKDNIGQINGTLLRFNPFLVATDQVSHSPSHAPEPLLNSGTRKVDIQNMNDMGGTLNIESTMQQ